MRFGVEYNLTRHGLLRLVCRTSESMRLTVIEAYVIWVVKGEISTSVRVTWARIDIQRSGYYLQVLEYLCKPETLCFVDPRGRLVIHVIYPGKTRRCRQISIETLDCTTRTLQVRLIACHTPSVEVAFQHFGTLDIKWISIVETVFSVEGKLILGGIAIPSEVPVCWNIRESLGPNTGSDISLVWGGGIRWRKHIRVTRVRIPTCIV